jgi:hypothetical protein
MRRLGYVAIAVLGIALLVPSADVALAARRPLAMPCRVSAPRVASPKVVVGAAFDATGVVVPAIAADDASTTVSVIAYRVGKRARLTRVGVFEAALTGPAGAGTGYAASLTLPGAGPYALVAVVVRDGVVLGRSTRRPVQAVLPYKVSPVRVARPKVAAGVAFDATGAVMPAIADDDASTTVSVVVYRVGRGNRLVQVGAFDAALTGSVGAGTGYAASVTLPSAGSYVLVAVVSRDGIVLGRSAPRPIKAGRVPRVAPLTPGG